MMKPDLHLHSTFSDGVLTPAQLVEKAAGLGVTLLSITDHDTFEGVDSLGNTQTPVPVIPGVELSLRDMHGLHLLGYGTGPARELRKVVRELADKRVARARSMVRRLEDMGMPLDWDSMTAGYSGTVGRAHIGRAMVARGYVSSMQEAIDRYIGEGKPAYVAGERLSMEEALALMRSEGFVPVLAHPFLMDKNETTLRMLCAHWKDKGLMGMEVYHPSSLGRSEPLERMARSLGLLVTGGSDYHKDGDSHGTPGCICSGWTGAEQDIRRLLEAIAEG